AQHQLVTGAGFAHQGLDQVPGGHEGRADAGGALDAERAFSHAPPPAAPASAAVWRAARSAPVPARGKPRYAGRSPGAALRSPAPAGAAWPCRGRSTSIHPRQCLPFWSSISWHGAQRIAQGAAARRAAGIWQPQSSQSSCPAPCIWARTTAIPLRRSTSTAAPARSTGSAATRASSRASAISCMSLTVESLLAENTDGKLQVGSDADGGEPAQGLEGELSHGPSLLSHNATPGW